MNPARDQSVIIGRCRSPRPAGKQITSLSDDTWTQVLYLRTFGVDSQSVTPHTAELIMYKIEIVKFKDGTFGIRRDLGLLHSILSFGTESRYKFLLLNENFTIGSNPLRNFVDKNRKISLSRIRSESLEYVQSRLNEFYDAESRFQLNRRARRDNGKPFT